jgi:hypothetical protein
MKENLETRLRAAIDQAIAAFEGAANRKDYIAAQSLSVSVLNLVNALLGATGIENSNNSS